VDSVRSYPRGERRKENRIFRTEYSVPRSKLSTTHSGGQRLIDLEVLRKKSGEGDDKNRVKRAARVPDVRVFERKEASRNATL
jgi:hypothetical protein